MALTKRIIEIIGVAVTYIVLARIGQLFAIEPGNVTPLWLPSGVMVALTLSRGTQIWPGVFIGAFCGNIWAYFSFKSLPIAASSIAAATLNGIGDVIACVVMAELVCFFTKTRNPFSKLTDLAWFISLGVIIGPLLSAIFGAGGLSLFNVIDSEKFVSTLSIWFFGDATGVLIFTPMLYLWLSGNSSSYPDELKWLGFLAIFSAILTAALFDILPIPEYIFPLLFLFIPIALYGFLYFGPRVAFSLLLVVGSVAVYATSQNIGIFADRNISHAIINLQYFLAILSLNIYVIAVFLSNKEKIMADLANKKSKLERLYRQDQLTKVWNRYRIKEFLEYELSRYERHGTIFGVLMFDLDDFKTINDTLGHLEGDKVLVELSNLVDQHTRQSDLFGRWGGEEFILILTDTTKEELNTTAEKIRILVEKKSFEIERQITISIGATIVEKGDSTLSLLDRVDDALYYSKKEGKNRVTFR